MAEYVVEEPSDRSASWRVHERIVRCGDCEHRRKSWNGHKPNFIDDWFCSNTGGHEVKPDGFCYRGKRKESE